MLPTPFVHATLIAFELPRDLADRYAEPERKSDPDDRDRIALLPQARPDHAPPWPFPSAH